MFGQATSDSIKTKVQKADFLLKLPFRKQQGKWQKRWFVCKDGFMLYYGSKKLKGGEDMFDVHPKGVIPLGNTTVDEYDPPTAPPPGFVTFRVTHPDFGSGALILACESEKSRQEWMSVIGDCGRITWENALVGDSMIERLRNKGTELEEEHNTALEEFKAEALRLRTEKDAFEGKDQERQRHADALQKTQSSLQEKQEAIRSLADAKKQSQAHLLAQQEAADQLTEANLRAEQEAKRLEEERLQAESAMTDMEKQSLLLAEQEELTKLAALETAEEAAEREEEARERLKEIEASGEGVDEQLDEERKRRLKAEKKLQKAAASLARLEKALEKLDGQQRADADADVKKLKSFFERRMDEEKKKASLVATMKNAITASKVYAVHKRKASQEVDELGLPRK